MRVSAAAIAAIVTLLAAPPASAEPTVSCRGPIRDVSSIAPAYVVPGTGPPFDHILPCLPARGELRISTTSQLSTNPKADDTATTATCGDLLRAAAVMRGPDAVLVMRHGTTEMSQATRESHTCKLGATDPDTLPCIAAVVPDPAKSQDEWFVNPNPRDYDRASSTKEAYVGNERNPQRQLDLQGAIESQIVGRALAAAGIVVAGWASSAYDRSVNTARLTKWAANPGSDEDGVALYWNVSGQFEKHARVYNLSFGEGVFEPYWADANRTVLRYPDDGFRKNVWLNYVYRNTLTDLAWAPGVRHLTIHGLFVLRALNIYNERGVTTVLTANRDAKGEGGPTYTEESTVDSDGNEVPFQLADTDNVRFEFQMAPSAFGALDSCTALAADGGYGSSARGLFALDADGDFEVTADEFAAGCAAADADVRDAVFAALDSEGARFGDDEAAMRNVEKKIAAYEVRSGMNYTAALDGFREMARTARLPRSLRGDGRVSVGVVQEARHFEPHMNWPYPDRVLRRHAEDLPRSLADLDALYAPEHALVAAACGGGEGLPPAVLDGLGDDSIVEGAHELGGLFAGCAAMAAPGPATLAYLYESYSAPNCPEAWQGTFVDSDRTQMPQGLPRERDGEFTFPDLYTGKDRTYGDDYKWGVDDLPPPPLGTYKSLKLRLAAALYCEGMLSMEELSSSMCNHDGERLAKALEIDASDRVSCENEGDTVDGDSTEKEVTDDNEEAEKGVDEGDENAQPSNETESEDDAEDGDSTEQEVTDVNNEADKGVDEGDEYDQPSIETASAFRIPMIFCFGCIFLSTFF